MDSDISGAGTTEIKELFIEDVVPDPNQPRKRLDEIKLKELAQSIQQHGLLQPILVRPLQNGKFQIVHGERRWRACKLIGMRSIRAEIKELSDEQVLEIQLLENLQREDLNPLEEAEAFRRLIEQFGYSHEQIAQRISKSRGYVTNKFRLLKLPVEIQEKLKDGIITEGHAKAILSLDDSTKQDSIINRVHEEKLSVRETEQLVHSLNVPRETLTEIHDKMLLISIPSKVYALLIDFAKKMKSKPEDLIVKAILAFVERK